ncbi:MAG: hypothetical protein KF691_13780 [Phycisphaeraceae bacterium]|nr:hypothetical protein [Phycisphaeraceae bacterium]
MSEAEDKLRLQQAAMREWLTRELSATDMLTVYLSDIRDQHNYGVYAALIPTEQVAKSLKSTNWDLSHGSGLPGAVEYHQQGSKRVEYHRFGDDDGIEPLVIDRDFHGARERYTEISEEFRLFHRLYHDQKLNQFIKIDNEGEEHLVATIEPNLVKIRVKEICQFLAIKEMHLALQFDCREDSAHTLEELGIDEEGSDYRRDLVCWGLHYGDIMLGSHRAFSRLLGKRLIAPFPKNKSGFWGYSDADPKKYVDFIIGTDKHGGPRTHSSNPDALGNNFGANPQSPNYLTPVHFRKSVLEKYYQQPQKYSVEDGYLRRASLWGMYLDNHHDDRVCAWLGDLGRDLPYEEQLHWRSHNIIPVGGMSKTFIRRQLDAEFADSDRPEHVFQERYRELVQSCDEVLGWQLLLPLTDADQHHVKGVRIPATDEQRDFDEVVLSLTKILIDSLNEKSLNECIPLKNRAGLKSGISRLEAAFDACGITGVEKHIKFLRDLQDLRSSGSAHRKGDNYRKIAARFGVDSQSLQSALGGILRKALEFLDYLNSVARSRRLPSKGTGAGSGGWPSRSALTDPQFSPNAPWH